MSKPVAAFDRHLLILVATAASLLLVGCGEQDLYEPPGSPFSLVGQVTLPSENEGIAVLGHHAYVAGGQAGLHIIDLAAPSRPELVLTLNTQKYAESVEVMRTFANQNLVDVALVVEGTEGITSYDITDPPNAVSFHQGTTAVDGNRIFVEAPADPDDPYIVYLAESWKGIRIFESSPEVPGLLNYNGVFAGTQGFAKGVAVQAGWAYVADDQMGLAVLDCRELAYGAVQVVSWNDTPGNALDVAVVGNHAYVADGSAGLAIFAINAGATPVKASELDLSGYCKAIVVRDNLACLAAAGAGVHFVDVANPNNPVYLGTLQTSYANDLALADEGYVLVADRDDGLLVLGGPGPFDDAAPPAAVTTLTAAAYTTSAINLSWYATGDDGLLGRADAYDLRRATTPINDENSWQQATPVSSLPTPGPVGSQETLLVGGLLPGTEYHFALKVLDEEAQPSQLSNVAMDTTYSGILLVNPSLDRITATEPGTFTYEVSYHHPQGLAPVTADLIIDDSNHHAMDYVSGDYGTFALFRVSVNVSYGRHTYAFHFDDNGSYSTDLPARTGPVVGRVAFEMGSPESELGRDPEEVQHAVVLTRDVIASPTEVTQADWTAMGLTNPSQYIGDQFPVENVTWLDAIGYCNLRSTADGLTPAYTIQGNDVTWNTDADGWRLPTEAEWEYLCRAGSTTAFAGGDITELECGQDPVLAAAGWYCGNAGPGTKAVAQKNSNAFGLFDMHGNVWEWCWDWHADYSSEIEVDPSGPATGFQRVIRGGSWYYFARECRSAARGTYYPSSRDNTVGFRVVRTDFSD